MNVMAIETESELLDIADQLREELVSRGNEIDKNRYLPQDLADKLASLGFYRLVRRNHLVVWGCPQSFFVGSARASRRVTGQQHGAFL